MIKKRQLRCSFCRKNESEVLKLVAGPRVYICDACVAIASRLMDDGSDNNNQHEQVGLSVWRKILARTLKFRRGSNARAVLAATE
jgi:ATP-dependent protease Clp ATPase subunit